METKLERIAEISANTRKPKFTSLYHHINEEMLKQCHNAIKAAYDRIYQDKINYIVDADIKGFFDNMSHEWIMKFLGVYISDPNFLWLINKYLKAGVMTDGILEDSISGSAQGSIISPVIANVYMHNVLMLWYKFIVLNGIKGRSLLVAYADDFIAGFQYKWEAERYYIELKKRMAKFNLELEYSKSRLLEFGRFAEGNRKARGEGKPETFDFLGFTFYCGRSRRGYPCTMLKTSRKKFRQKLKNTKKWLYENRTMPVKLLIKSLNLKLIGHYRYYGISFNGKMITNFLHRVQQSLFKTLNRRSDKKSYS